MRNTLLAALIAPAPIFAFLLLLLVKPSLGWPDAMFATGVALALSYGFMLAAGLPTHLLLQRLGWTGWAQYMTGFLLALVLIVVMATAVEAPSPQPLPNDNSPFAELTLRGGGWVLVLVLGSPFVTIMGSVFWHRAVRLRTSPE